MTIFLCVLCVVFFIKDIFIYRSFKSKFHKDLNELKDFKKAVLSEKQSLTELLKYVKAETHTSQNLSQDVLKKIQFMAIELDQQAKENYHSFSQMWDDMKANLQDTHEHSKENMTQLIRRLEKLCLEADHHCTQLEEKTEEAKRIFHVFQGENTLEDILQEISDEKYTRAKHLMQKGLSVVEAAKATGLSISEVSLAAQS